jgi:hypothetical protein
LPGDDAAEAVAGAHRVIADLKLTEEVLRRSLADLAWSRRDFQLTID